MADDRQLDHLIGMLYETALGPRRRKEAVGFSGQYANGVDAQLLTIEKTNNTPISVVRGAMFLNGEQTRQVFINPLPAASPFAKDWQTPLALVLVIEAGNTVSTLQLLGKLYDLTPAELRVASALLAGNSPEQYALEADVTQNTVRSQLKSLFRKTGTRRQSELVAVLSRVPLLQS